MAFFTELWNKIVTEAKDANIVGDAFDLSCGNHGNKAKISKPEEFNRKSPAGQFSFEDHDRRNI